MTASLGCIIIEDEPLAMEKARGFVGKIPDLKVLSTFDNALDGLTYLRSNKVDILFLDINMDELSGIELLETHSVQSQIIFTTAYSEYALRGYELNVTDYLLKPYSFARFVQAVNKAQENIKQLKNTVSQDYILSLIHI